MKFTKIRLSGLSSVDLPIVGAQPSDLFSLLSMDGLGPPELDVLLGDSLDDESIYQGRRALGREPVGLVGLNPDWGGLMSASDLRTTLYGLLTPNLDDYLMMQLMDTDTVVAQTKGYVKKLEINPFSKDPQVQLTFACPKTYLEAPADLFVAPASKTNPEIENTGSAPSGFRMEVIFTANLSSWTLTNAAGKKIQVTYDFLIGDKLIIDTRPGSTKGVWVVRSASTTNIIWAVSGNTTWLKLLGGTNVFTTSSASFNWGDVFFRPLYWGI